MMNIRLLGGIALMGAAVLLSGCVAYPAGASYGEAASYGNYGYGGYGDPYYATPAPVMVAPSVYYGVDRGRYYDGPRYRDDNRRGPRRDYEGPPRGPQQGVRPGPSVRPARPSRGDQQQFLGPSRTPPGEPLSNEQPGAIRN
ncbi:hypothetical protein ACSFA2_22165 [Variovorax sp. LT2P21]|uniref:hypothetical protein n=1 Tax=Variovorax sp. LT2P21 TaxID=3443731 RepID=UPI003F45402D